MIFVFQQLIHFVTVKSETREPTENLNKQTNRNSMNTVIIKQIFKAFSFKNSLIFQKGDVEGKTSP